MTFAPQNPVVWMEIPVSDMDRSVRFYNEAFGYGLSVDNSGPNPMAVLPSADGKGVAGHLYPGKPASANGPTIHLAVPDTLEATIERWTGAGGKVLSDPIPLPFGRFAYGTDPDGNSIGLFQAAG